MLCNILPCFLVMTDVALSIGQHHPRHHVGHIIVPHAWKHSKTTRAQRHTNKQPTHDHKHSQISHTRVWCIMMAYAHRTIHGKQRTAYTAYTPAYLHSHPGAQAHAHAGAQHHLVGMLSLLNLVVVEVAVELRIALVKSAQAILPSLLTVLCSQYTSHIRSYGRRTRVSARSPVFEDGLPPSLTRR